MHIGDCDAALLLVDLNNIGVPVSDFLLTEWPHSHHHTNLIITT